MGIFGGFIDGYEGSIRSREAEQRAADAHEAALEQRKQAGFEAESRDRTRKGWGLQDAGLKTFQEEAGKLNAGMDAPQEDANSSFRRSYGMMPVAGTMYDSGSDQVIRTAPEQPKAPVADYFLMEKDRLKSIAKIAEASGDKAGFFSAHADLKKLRMNQDAAMISNGILSMPEPEYQQLVAGVSKDERNTYKMEVGPDGFTKLAFGDSQVKLSRPQVALYFAAKHRLASGDGSALADISAIDDKLAAKEAAEFGRLHTVTQTNNQSLANSNTAIAQKNTSEAQLITANANKTTAEQKIENDFPPAVKLQLQAIEKRRGEIAKSMDTLKTAEGQSYDPKVPNGAMTAFTKEKFNLDQQEKAILQQYAKAAAPRPDPIGLNAPPASPVAASPTKVSPAQQKINDANRPVILAQESAKVAAQLSALGPRTAANSAEIDRLLQDLKSLKAEQARLPRQ